MKRLILIIALIFCTSKITCQQLYTNKGETIFDGSKESFEPIKAVNNNSVSLIDINNGRIAALIYIKDFEFRLGLMQEHFNENYMFSNKYPKSTFEGVIQNFNYDKLENNYTNFIIEGEIEIKGVKKNISTVGVIKKTVEGIDLNTNFNIKLSDFDIKIPRLVFKKIDENIKVSLNYNYEKK
tara:strand:+ start:1099 stop:1644 length:546 start_codon:yes stop_codon:yes gene_type:complete